MIVQVDDVLLRQVLATIDQTIYVPHLRPRQRFPIQELRNLVDASCEPADSLVSRVCQSCGVDNSRCRECGETLDINETANTGSA